METCSDSYEWSYCKIRSHRIIFQILPFYCSPHTPWTDFSPVLPQLTKLIDEQYPVLLMGDFNKLALSPFYSRMVTEHGRSQLINQSTTVNDSRLDLIFTDIPSDRVTSGVIDICWSDHRLVWCNFTL